jgi:putative DNA primase/helicase
VSERDDKPADDGAAFAEGVLNVDAELRRLADLPPLDYDRERGPAARRLGCRTPTLDREVAKRRGDPVDVPSQGRSLDLRKPDPWPVPVDGAALLDELTAAIRQYVVLAAHQAEAIALWVIFTHAFDAFDFSPRLVISSAEKRSGKTRLVEVLDRVVCKPLFVSGISGAALLRVIEAQAPTMLLDEIDTLMKGDTEMREALRGLINSGFTRAAARFIKNVPAPDGGYEPRAFSTWCPMLLAGIGRLPDTVADRAILIGLERKRPTETVKPLRARDGGELRDIGRKAARWANDNLDALSSARPATPEQIYDRAADAWSPLLAITDLAAGSWPERARSAAIELVVGADDQDSMRVAALADIRAAFVAKQVDRITSEDLANYLAGLEDRPWAEYRNNKPITKTQIALLLKPLRVSPGTIRLAHDRTAKGYYRQAFDDAFSRYLPSTPISGASHRHKPQEASVFDDTQASQAEPNVTDAKFENARKPAGCDGVTPEDSGADAQPNQRQRRSRWHIDPEVFRKEIRRQATQSEDEFNSGL